MPRPARQASAQRRAPGNPLSGVACCLLSPREMPRECEARGTGIASRSAQPLAAEAWSRQEDSAIAKAVERKTARIPPAPGCQKSPHGTALRRVTSDTKPSPGLGCQTVHGAKVILDSLTA